MTQRYDAAVVGAGIVGLAHAYHLAQRGLRVGVFERSLRAQGASVRNFGMLWPVGQTSGEMLTIALRSRAIWGEVLRESGIWHDPVGCLHLAYRDDEERVLREFASTAPAHGYRCELVEPGRVGELSRAVKRDGLRAVLWSETEACVDPRQVVAELPGYLSNKFGVAFHFGTTATRYDRPTLTAGGASFGADRLFVCSGDDLRTLYPEALSGLGLVPCKLQMMRTMPQPGGWRLGPMLAAGLTLRHYKAFAECPSLPALKARVAAENPEYDRYGVHVMASQNGLGELVLGDSHEYGDAIEPFDKSAIDAMILDYLATFLDAPDTSIASRWHGVYVKHPSESYKVVRPTDGVVAVTGLGGAGMTLSFGLVERVLSTEC